MEGGGVETQWIVEGWGLKNDAGHTKQVPVALR